MSSFNRVVLSIVSALSLAFLVACGSSSSHVTPPPTGGFTYSNLSGTYVFSTLGVDSTSGETMTIVGAFTACGCSQETISGGTFDYLDLSASTPLATQQSIGSGSYTITADGRGQVTLVNSTVLGNIVLDFVLNSTGGGFVSEFNSFGTGSGTLELQSATTLGSAYAFSVSGENVASGPSAYAMVGAFTLNSSGNLTNTSYDQATENLSTGSIGGVENSSYSASSSLAVGTGTTPGQATFSDTSTGATYTFDVYAVSANDLKLFETDGIYSATGDAFPQSTSLPSGTLAFTMNGIDPSGYPLSTGGLLTFSGTTISSGIEDFNDGNIDVNVSGGAAGSNSSVAGSFNNAITDGRASLQLTNYFNGSVNVNGTPVTTTYTFAAYPTANGTLLLEIDGSGISAGNALTQTNTSLAASQGYAMDVSATNMSSSSGFFEEDDIAEFSSTSSGFSGNVDVNDEGTTYFKQGFNGTYTSLTTGRYSLSANSVSNFQGMNGAVYTVDGNVLLFLDGDDFRVGTGMLEVQDASASNAQAARHVSVFRGLLAARNAAKRKQK